MKISSIYDWYITWLVKKKIDSRLFSKKLSSELFLWHFRGGGGGEWTGGGGCMEHWKVLSATMVTMLGRQEKYSNSRRSRIAKTIIFWPWWQPFNSFYFETLSFLPLSPFFLFATQKGRTTDGGGGAWPPGIAGPAF